MTDAAERAEEVSGGIGVCSLEEMAALLDVTVNTVRRWISKGCPVQAQGRNGKAYELDPHAVKAWRDAQDARELREVEERAERLGQLKLELLGGAMLSDPGGAEALSPRERAEALAAEVNKVRLAQMQRQLVNAEEVKRTMAQTAGLLQQRLRAMPDELARRCDLDEGKIATMLEIVDELLNDLADDIDRLESPSHADQLAA